LSATRLSSATTLGTPSHPSWKTASSSRRRYPSGFSGDVAFTTIVLALVGAYATIRTRSWLPAILFVGLFTLYRLFFLPHEYYEWYLPPYLAVVVLLAAAGLQRIRRVAPKTGVGLAVALGFLYSMHMPLTFPLEARVQHDIEDRVRTPMARYLDDVVPRGDIVVSESAGYVGYYSDVTLYDYPGLTSPGALRILRRLGTENNNLLALIVEAKPDWIVMRPNEIDALRLIYPSTAREYAEVRQFSVPFEESSLARHGIDMINVDRHFIVLRRQA
jgi:hypothetical protein